MISEQFPKILRGKDEIIILQYKKEENNMNKIVKVIKRWWNYKTPNAGGKGILENLIYKLMWRFGGATSPSLGTYKQFKNKDKRGN